MKRWMLTEAAFIGAALLAAGSIITEEDLPVGIDPTDEEGEREIRSDPPTSSIEINEAGQAVKKKDRAAAAALGIGYTEVAPIAPHAPNPTMPQALPPHGVGDPNICSPMRVLSPGGGYHDWLVAPNDPSVRYSGAPAQGVDGKYNGYVALPPSLHPNGKRYEWAVPLAADPDFSDICVNTIKAPTRNRHFMSTGSGIEPIVAAGNEITIATTDVMNIDLVDALRTKLDSMPLPPPPS